MIQFKIAFRNIFRQRRRSLFTGLTISGGYILLSLSLSVAEGTYGRMIDTFTRMKTGHVQLHQGDYLVKPSIYKTINDVPGIERKIVTVPQVLSWTPRVYAGGLAFVGSKTTIAQIIGIDPLREKRTTTLSRTIDQGRFLAQEPADEVIIGAGLAQILGAKLGDQLVLISQAADGSIANNLFAIVGIFDQASDSFERMNCYLHISTAQTFLELPDRIHEIALITSNYAQSYELTQQLTQSIHDDQIDIKPWQVVEEQFFKAMSADIKGMWILLVIIMLIVGIGVLNAVLMTILERTREFGVLKALGTRPVSIFTLIVFEMIFLASFATIVGFVLSIGVNSYFTLVGLNYPTPIDVGGIAISKMQGIMTFRSFWIPALITFCTAAFVSIFPALRAARIIPVRALRSH